MKRSATFLSEEDLSQSITVLAFNSKKPGSACTETGSGIIRIVFFDEGDCPETEEQKNKTGKTTKILFISNPFKKSGEDF